MTELKIKGCKVNNLKNIDVSIPLGKITVVTGMSGSGKSSLIFDTIYAESSRRFIESLGAYQRQYLMKLPAPEIETAENMPPAVAIRYRPISVNSRSTVGTSTEIYDYFRLLFAKGSHTWCSECNEPIKTHSAGEAAAELLEKHAGGKCVVCFAVSIDKKEADDKKKELLRKGFYRVFKDGETVNLDDLKPKQLTKSELRVIVDRVKLTEKNSSRIAEAVEQAYHESGGEALALLPDSGAELEFSEIPHCRSCGQVFEPAHPALFSFNNPRGACPECRGFGDLIYYDPDKVIPDHTLSIEDGAVVPLEYNRFRYFKYHMLQGLKKEKIRPDVPWEELTDEERGKVWSGTKNFEGIDDIFKILEKKRYRVDVRSLIARFRSYSSCHLCGGSRLTKDAMNYRVAGKTIHDFVRMSVSELYKFMRGHDDEIVKNRAIRDLFEHITGRIEILCRLGVGYLTLERLTRTLSGGELQRINLTNAVGGRLTGTLYLMDEPSIGLHPSDEEGIKDIIRSLRDLGNTILITEHSRSFINLADHIIELGPIAGEQGGEITFAGPLEEYKEKPETLTAKYLTGELKLPIPDYRREPGQKRIKIKGAGAHNLKEINLTIPLEQMVCITGPSGAGKSSLLFDTVYGYWLKHFKNEGGSVDPQCAGLEGLDALEDVIYIEGGKISRSPRSTVATYMGIFNEIRNIYAGLRSARMAGLEPKHFSFNTPHGRCGECQGRGFIEVDLQFLPQVKVTCESCGGSRFTAKPLKHYYMQKNIHDIMRSTGNEAQEIFEKNEKITKKLKLLRDLNLDYLTLGQPLDTLSSGEAARLRLARLIGRGSVRGRLFLFDEPSLGLHPYNIERLNKVFTRLVVEGGSVICIDHNLDIIKHADYIIDMGPGGGDNGGEITALGTPEEIAENPDSPTGRFLSDLPVKVEKQERGRKPLTKSY